MVGGRVSQRCRGAITPSSRVAAAATTVLLALVAAACTADSSTTTGPSPLKCQVAATLSANDIDAAGGQASLSVATTPECTWSASTQVSWITGISPASGQGSANLTFRVAPNTLPSPREGDLLVNDEHVRVRQQAAVCRIDVAPTTIEMDASGGAAILTITAPTGCDWTARATDTWIILANPSGTGNGAVSITVASNPGEVRAGTVTIAGFEVAVRQRAAPSVLPTNCTYQVEPLSQWFPSTGGAGGPVAVTTTEGCSWTATSNATWISVAENHAGSGSGTVRFSVALNTGSARSGTMTIAGRTFTVSQDGVTSCAFTVVPTSLTVDHTGGTPAPVTVTTTAACGWTASGNADWVTIVSGPSGTGSGSVTLQVAANNGGARLATLTVAGHAVTVSQGAAPCSYAIAPTSAAVGAQGGSGQPFAISTNPGCAWTVATDVSWITITSSRTGTGSASVTYNVAPNTAAERSGTIAVADRTFTVTQAAGTTQCSYTIDPTTRTVAFAGGTTSVAVSTSDACAWTAQSQASWISIASGSSGAGSASVVLNVEPNTGAARTGTVVIASHTFTVQQAAAPAQCTYSIDPTSRNMPASGGAASVAVATSDACAWTAQSQVSWITVGSGGSGTGSGSVALNVAANAGPARTGTVAIAGHTFTVEQSSGCTYTIDPTSQSAGAEGGPGIRVTVTTASGCDWRSTSNADWLTVTSGQSGSGPGTVTFSIAANTGAARTGTLTIAGHTFTVTQAAASLCAAVIAPTSQRFDAKGGEGVPIVVTIPLSCPWMATTNVEWITINDGASGTGPGTVRFHVAPLTMNGRREGIITVAGQTFTVTQLPN